MLAPLATAECEVRSAEGEGSNFTPRIPHSAPAPGPGVVEVRPASPADMLQIEPLINGFAEKGLMLPKTREQLLRMFREFVVATDGSERVLGCGALRVFTPQLAEVASLAVDESAHGLGVGRKLVEQLEIEARRLGIGTIFALTLEEGFFHRLGFRTVSKEMFPLKVWADCRSCAKLHACDEIAVVKEL